MCMECARKDEHLTQVPRVFLHDIVGCRDRDVDVDADVNRNR